MKTKKKNRLDDEALGVLVDSRIREAVGWFSSKLSTEREKVLKYYNGEAPKRASEGSSSYVSTDVYDSVEAMKAQLLETFAAGRDIIRFDAQNEQDVRPSEIATAYTDYVLFRQNDGYQVFNDVIHDGLTARVGVTKTYWQSDLRTIEEEVTDLTSDEVDGMVANDEIESMDVDLDEVTGLYSGTITKTEDRSQVRIEVINPEEFAIESQAKELNEDYFCVHRTVKTIADLKRDGYDVKKLKDYNPETDDYLQSLPEVLARFKQVDDGSKPREQNAQDDDLRPILVHEAYIKAIRKVGGDEKPKLLKVVRAGSETLDIEEVDELPFDVFVPLPIPHSFYGNNFAARVIPTQNSNTVLTRSILDHAAITNNPRYQVLKGGMTNPRELLDNRLGGLVNVTRPDAITPLPQTALNPFVYQTLEMLKARNEETTGISSLSQGLNKDAVSKQNSAAMVENLVSLSQTRQKIIARNFAQFLTKLFLRIYRIALANEKKQSIIEVAGDFVDVNPRLWRERKIASVSLHLGYGEQEREAGKYTTLLAMGSQDPELSRMLGAQGKYRAAIKVLKLNGIMGVNDFLTPPEKLPPQQPDPMVIKQMQQADKQLEIQDKAATAQLQKVEVHAQIEQMKLTMAQMEQKFQQMLDTRDAARKDAETANKIDISQRETKIAEEQPPTETKAIVSPNS